MARTIYACRCGSTRLWRDAAQDVNDPENFVTYDSVVCGLCDYDGANYHLVEVPDDFDEDRVDVALLTQETEVYL